jgi:hypothetical protein
MDPNELKRKAESVDSSNGMATPFVGMTGVGQQSVAPGEHQSTYHTSSIAAQSQQEMVNSDDRAEEQHKRQRVEREDQQHGVITTNSDHGNGAAVPFGVVQANVDQQQDQSSQIAGQVQSGQPSYPGQQSTALLAASSHPAGAFAFNLPHQHAIVGPPPGYQQGLTPLNPANFFQIMSITPQGQQDFQQQTATLMANPMVVAAAQALMYSQAYGLATNPAAYGYLLGQTGQQPQGQHNIRNNTPMNVQYPPAGFPMQQQQVMASAGPSSTMGVPGSHVVQQPPGQGGISTERTEAAALSGQVGAINIVGLLGGAQAANQMLPSHLYPQVASSTPQQGGRRKRGPLLYTPIDEDILAENQILVRKQIEFFEAEVEDVETITSGRRRPIVLGQVGIQCKHCAHLSLRQRKKAAIYYPSKVNSIYQAAQNMNVSHLSDACQHIDGPTKSALMSYLDNRSSQSHGGKQYWASSAKTQGIYETENDGLRYAGAMMVNQQHEQNNQES